MKAPSSLDVIGLGCRYPGDIYSAADLWRTLQAKISRIGPPPPGRWRRVGAVSSAHEKGKSVTDRAGWLSHIERFDAGYFQLSPNEAADMDPQQRLALEVSIEALVDANISPKSLAGRRVGVFVGAANSDQQVWALSRTAEMTTHSMTGSALSIIANRISYCLDLTGPSLTVDSACSSALTALHVCHRTLESGDCDLAIVVGVSALVSDAGFVGFSQAHMLSPRGVSAPFDVGADGFVRAEGCGAVIVEASGLRRESPRRVYARVVATGVNEDGKSRSMTAPSPERQRDLMREVLAQAGVRPEQVAFVEAHGTGTPVGDPVEATSIGEVFGVGRDAPVPIGSVKGHLGHMEAGAGLCALIKATLCLYHRQLVPTAGHDKLSDKIDGRRLNVRVPVQCEPLPSGGPLMGAVSSYGFGGANAFALLRDAAELEVRDVDGVVERAAAVCPTSLTLALSSHVPQGLNALTEQAAQLPADALTDAAASWGDVHGRERHRRAWVGVPGPDFLATAECFEGTSRDTPPRLLFCFGGGGSHSARMGSELYARYPQFRDFIAELDKAYAAVSGVSLVGAHGLCRGVLSPALMQNAELIVPCIALAQAALTRLLQTFGVRPAAVIGHSTGEMVAAFCAGALTVDDFCFLVHARATHQAQMRPGAMAALALGPRDATALLAELAVEGRVQLAAVNTAAAVTIAGDVDAVAAVVEESKRRGLRCTRLDVSRAYHSHHVRDIALPLGERLRRLVPRTASVPLVSTVAGLVGVRPGPDLDAAYWVNSVLRPVAFDEACRVARPLVDLAVEVSLRPVLVGYAAENIPDVDAVPLVAREQSEPLALERALARLYVAGADVDWRAVAGGGRRFVAAPRIPWDYDKSTVPRSLRDTGARTGVSAGAGRFTLQRDEHGFFADHRVEGRAVLPGAAYVMRAMAALDLTAMREVAFKRFLPLWVEGDATDLRLEPTAAGGQWVTEAGVHMTFQRASDCAPSPSEDPQTVRARCGPEVDGRRIYANLRRLSGLELGGAFESLTAICVGDAEAVAGVKLPEELDAIDRETLALDASFQLLGFSAGLDSDFWAPTSATRIVRLGPLPATGVTCTARLTAINDKTAVGDLAMYDRAGALFLTVDGMTLTRVPCSTSVTPDVLTVDWQEMGAPATERGRLDADPVTAMRQLLRASAGRVLRVLDLTGRVLDDAVRRETVSGTLYGLGLGSTDPGPGVAAISSIEEVGARSFDVVVGDGGERFVGPRGVLVGASWNGALPPGEVAPPPRWTRFGENYVPGFGKEVPLAEADLIVDSRDALLAASELVREAPPAARLLFILYEGVGRPPSALWGFARAVRAEETRDVRVIALPLDLSPSHAGALLDALLRDGLGGEAEIALRHGVWRVPRLVRAPRPKAPTCGLERRLEVGQPGQLSSLRWRPIAVENEGLRPHEVGLRVHHAALNFKDIMLAMGLLPGLQPILGIECVGTIRAIGARAAQEHPELAVGTRVLCCPLTLARTHRESLLATAAVVDAEACFPLPPGVPALEASAFLGAFATSWYALDHAARLREGETVLIHSAAGGVGQAAVQIALERRARVIASAGTAEKRAWLRERHELVGIIDSRQPDSFVSEILRLTGGRGVDVTLNSLSGDGMVQTVRCLASGGRHVEIGKRDILQRATLPLELLRENISFLSVQLDVLATRAPDQVRRLFVECLNLLTSGRAQLLPTTCYPAGDVEAAMRLMSAGRHTGRLVIDLDEGIPPHDESWPAALFSATKTQLVTGGMGGVGLALARLLAERGAGRLLLVGRRTTVSRRAELELEGLRRAHPSTRFETRSLDVTDRRALEELFACEPDIAGIFHAASDFKEQRAGQIDKEALSTWEIKVGAAWALHEMSRGRNLRHFVLIGSAAGLHGNSGQAAYVAANAALHEIIRQRRALDLPGIAFDLPAVLGVGRLSEPRYVRELDLVTKWLPPVSFARLGAAMIPLVAGQESPASAALIKAEVSEKLLGANRFTAFYEHLQVVAPPSRVVPTNWDGRTARDRVRSEVARLLGATSCDVDPERPLTALGLDSLAAVELSIWLRQEFSVEVSQTELLTGLSVAAIAHRCEGRLARAPDSATSAGKGQRNPVVSQDAANEAGALPSLPLPTLADTLSRLETLGRSFLSATEQATLRAACASFLIGDGPSLQAELVRRAAENRTSYVFEIWMDKYLCCRAPLPFQSAAVHLGRPLDGPDWAVAAALLAGVAHADAMLRAGSVRHEMQAGRPLCMALAPNVLGGTRVPAESRDQLQRATSPEHAFVAIGGALFPIRITVAGVPRDPVEIGAELRALPRGQALDAVGLLTSLPRQRWATVRESLQRVGDNVTSLAAIDEAACVLSLDGEIDPGLDAAVRNLVTGNLRNRWFDKSLQLVVTSDAGVGAIMEHSGFDATQLGNVMRTVLAGARQAFELTRAGGAGTQDQLAAHRTSSLRWDLSDDARTALEEARAGTQQIAASYAVTRVVRGSIDRALLRREGIHPDVFIQLALQLAYFRLRGGHAIGYQPVHTRQFRYGRTEALRPATAEMLAYVRAFAAGQTADHLGDAFRAATESFLAQQARCLEAQGVDRHLLALRTLASERGLAIPLFDGAELDRVIGPAPLCTSTAEVGPEFGDPIAAFFPETADGFGVAYTVTDRGVSLVTTSRVESAEQFKSSLESSLDDLALALLGKDSGGLAAAVSA